ncbi:MAG: hypothetical protein O3C21_15190, partial [Verrucomicrobia bacterium]|nr:hypothetical protein [Verrucomicrobiota bacterium]
MQFHVRCILLTRCLFLLLGMSLTQGWSSADEVGTGARLTLHEDLVEAWRAQDPGVDLGNLRSVFWHVFSKIPNEVRVYPSENYYYWQLDIDGRHITGNIRFPAKQRDDGFISFAYSERRVVRGESAEAESKRIAGRAMLGRADGVTLTKIRNGVYDMGYSDHFVRFHLENLSQAPPEAAQLRNGEEFVGRTCDESGLRFLLIYQNSARYFFWMLDEAEGAQVVEHFEEFGPGVLIGRRTGFAFRVDEDAADRKVLIAVKSASVSSNDYYDGPFDQLPENHVTGAQLRARMIHENPALDGKIDDWGYYFKDDPPMRVALARYANYRDDAHL